MAADADNTRHSITNLVNQTSFINVQYGNCSMQSRINYTHFYSLYQRNITKYSKYLNVPSHVSDEIASRTIHFLSDFDIHNIFISLSSNNSIIFRFTPYSSHLECQLEVFLDYNPQDEEDIEAIFHLYKNGVKQSSYYGLLADFYMLIRDNISEIENHTLEQENNNPLYTSTAEKELSYATYSQERA